MRDTISIDASALEDFGKSARRRKLSAPFRPTRDDRRERYGRIRPTTAWPATGLKQPF